MKKLLFLLFIVTYSMNIFAQDTIALKNGESIYVKITKDGSNEVEFTYPNETITNTKSKKEIAYIVFASGRREECHQGIQVPKITSPNDWEKVVVTYLESDVEGLTRVDEIKATSGWGGSLGSSIGYKGAIKKLKKKAAKMGAGVILVHGSPNQSAAALGGGVQVIATAYK